LFLIVDKLSSNCSRVGNPLISNFNSAPLFVVIVNTIPPTYLSPLYSNPHFSTPEFK
jgi:hypothetical protein